MTLEGASHIGCLVSHRGPDGQWAEDGRVDRETATSLWVGGLRLVRHPWRGGWCRHGNRDEDYEVELPEVRDYGARRAQHARVTGKLSRTKDIAALTALVDRIVALAD